MHSQLIKKIFFFLLEIVQKNPSMKDTRIKEYGVDFDNQFIEAFSFKVEGHFLIIIKKTVSLNASLEHELRHIISEIEFTINYKIIHLITPHSILRNT
jgi:hypothetical protein